MTRTCPECDTELVNENQGRYRLQFDYPHYVCPNPKCKKSSHYTPTCPTCGTELLVDVVCPGCTERMNIILETTLPATDMPEPDETLEARIVNLICARLCQEQTAL